MLKISLLVAASGGALLTAVAASAQTPPPPAQAATVQGGGQSQVDSPDIVVTAPRLEIKARQRQENALNIVEVQSAETIEKYPDFNAAEALGRIPGVSLSSDTGEGRFVNIRGIDANLNGATFGGVVLLNTYAGGTAAGGGGRAVEFDTVPTGAIDGIVVTKTRMPDQEGEGLGGIVELTPRSAAHIDKPFLTGDLGWGYEPLHDNTGPFQADLAGGVRWGFDDKGLVLAGPDTTAPRAGWISNPTPFSLVISVSRKDDRRGIDDLEESYIDANTPPTDKTIHQYDLRRYNYHRRRFSYGGEFDFQPNDDHGYYARASVAGYTESNHKNFLLFTNMQNGTNADGMVDVNPADPKGYVTTTTPEVTSTDEQETHRNQVYAVGGHDRFSDLLIDYRASYSRATYLEGHNYTSTFAGPAGTPIAYDNSGNGNFPTFQFITDATHPVAFNPDNASAYNLVKLNNQSEFDVDEELAYAADAIYHPKLLGDFDQLKFGTEIRLRDKVVDPILFSGITVPAGVNLSTVSGPANTYYGGRYPNGPFINTYDIRAIYQSELANITSATDPSGYFKAREDIFAGYGQYDATFGKLNVLAGARVEATQARYGAYQQIDDNAPVFTNSRDNYTNVFPTVQAKYDIARNLIFRAIYSTGIARPGFEQNNATATIDTTTDPGTVLISRGNPALKPTTGNMFDLSLEYFMPNAGILELGLFDKEFSNYIVPRVVHGTTTDPLAPGQLADVTTYLNISSAHARGIELAYQQKFTFLPGVFSGLGIEGNATLVDSRLQEYDAATSGTGLNEYGLLPGTSTFTWNLAGYYEKYGVQMRLAAEYVSPSLFALGGDKSLDTIQDKRLTLDLTSAYQLDNHFQLYFNAKNLLNTPLRYYEGSADRPIQREFYDVTIEGGVRFRF